MKGSLIVSKCEIKKYFFIQDDVPHVCGGVEGNGDSSSGSNRCWRLNGQTGYWSHAGR